MALAIAPGVEIVASAVVASETDINSLIVQIHCDGLRFTDTTKMLQQLHQQNQNSPSHQLSQPTTTGVRSAGVNGPLHNEALQLAELLVFLDRQLSRFVRIPYEPNPTITESTHDTIMFLLSMPSPHLLPSLPMHHEFVILYSHHASKIRDGGSMLLKKDEIDPQRIRSADSNNRRGSTLQSSDSIDSFSAIESVLTAWGSVYKSSGGSGVAMAWKYVFKTSASVQSHNDNNGLVDGVTVLICLRARMSAGIAVFDAFGFNCPHSLIKAECDSGFFPLILCFGHSNLIPNSEGCLTVFKQLSALFCEVWVQVLLHAASVFRSLYGFVLHLSRNVHWRHWVPPFPTPRNLHPISLWYQYHLQ
jgi:hypothetical protein